MLIDTKIFSIWPEISFSSFSLVKPFAKSSRDIEDIFDAYYPDASSVLFSSCRAGLSAIISNHFSRKNHVWIPPFLSHCVISSIGLTATPTPVMNELVDATLVSHQWGFVHKPETQGLIIEDSVDTLIETNGRLFPNDGRYELLSLPKIFGTMFGGIVLCQNRKDAELLRRVREKRKMLKWLHVLNKLMSNYSDACRINWNHAEPENGFLPQFACADIYEKITCIDSLVSERKTNFAYAKSLNLSVHCENTQTRWPTCLPLSANRFETYGSIFKPFQRHFSIEQDFQTMTKVLPIAIHKGVNQSTIKQLKEVKNN